MKEIIRITEVERTFSVPVRSKGFIEALKSLFSREFKTVEAVKKTSFTIEEGEIVGLLGPNGAGKSTLIKMMTGVLAKTSGDINILGLDPFSQRSKYVKNIGALFGQKTQLWWDLPAVDSFELTKHLYKIDEKEFNKRLKDMISRLRAETIVNQPVRNMSLGERMKCEFIMALLHNPKIVFLDEPTIGLDVNSKEAIREFVLYANQIYNTTFILTTHDMDDVEHLANRVIVINHGEIVFDDAIEKLQKVAGEKKYVRVVGREKLPKLKQKGITKLTYHSDFEASFTLDRKKLPLDKLTKQIATTAGIQDLEVKDPEVEQIIKKIYDK